MEGTKYTLTGFDDFLERRRVAFVEPLPRTRVCGVCGVVPSQSLLLPCGDVLCQVCKGQNGTEDGTCPLDGMAFAEADIVLMSFKQCHLEQYRVLCIVEGEKCNFAGKLSELKDHLATCSSDQVTCAKCQVSVLRNAAAEHYRRCSAGIPSGKAVSATGVASAIYKLGDMKKDLEKLQGLESSGKMELDGVVNFANVLAEHMASIEHDLFQIQQAGAEQCELSSTSKKMVVTAIPSSAASKRDVFISTCVFTDVYDGYKVLNGDKKEHSLSTGFYSLAGYKFKVYGNLKKGINEEVLIHFTLCLFAGAWDDWLEWPFSKKVTIIIRHPRDEGKDITLPLLMEDSMMVRKPPPETWNSGISTKATNWKDLEMQGFFRGRNLLFKVEFQ